jgi:hypothetical protein
MTIYELQEIIDEHDYWDARVRKVDCNYFSDEVKITYEDGSSEAFVEYHFSGCYKCSFDHVKNYDKIVQPRNMTIGQIPYFIQSVKIDETTEGSGRFWICKINMFPLYVEIWCKNMTINKQRVASDA